MQGAATPVPAPTACTFSESQLNITVKTLKTAVSAFLAVCFPTALVGCEKSGSQEMADRAGAGKATNDDMARTFFVREADLSFLETCEQRARQLHRGQFHGATGP